MVSLYARSQRGRWAYAKQPKGRGKNLTILDAMSLKEEFLEGLSFIGGITGDIFLWFIETLLCLLLWTGAVVVIDNLPAHEVDGVRQSIGAVGARLVHPSPYSPDFNPIENLWSKLKQYLRAIEARTLDALQEAIAEGLSRIILEEVHHWFARGCYCAYKAIYRLAERQCQGFLESIFE